MIDVRQGDCLELIKDIPNNTIQLTITSPPYFNAKKYGEEKLNVGNNESYISYLNKLDFLVKELYRTTEDGGYVCFNTSPVLDNGKRYAIPFDIHGSFIKYGFDFLEDIIWKKPDGAGRLRCGGWCQNKHKPTTWYANLVAEYVNVYKKPGKRVVGKFQDCFINYNKDILTNVWYINPETNLKWHDAPYPEELVRRLVLLYSFEEDTILDPFAGALTTLKVAKDLNRNAIGLELNQKYIDMGKERLKQEYLL